MGTNKMPQADYEASNWNVGIRRVLRGRSVIIISVATEPEHPA